MRQILKKLFDGFIKLIPKYIRLMLFERGTLLRHSTFPDADIMVHCRSRLEFYGRYKEWETEPETVEWIRSFKGGVFFDIGANIGTFSLIAASMGKATKVFSFEPSCPTFYSLCDNVRINHLEEVIVPCHLALGKNNGLIKFYYCGFDPGGSLHNLGENIDYKGEKFEGEFAIPMMSCAVDQFIECFNAPYPNYIKMDVDGLELEIVEGMPKVLSNPELKSMLIEVNPDRGGPLIEGVLARFGFTPDIDLMKKHQLKPHPVTGSLNTVFFRR